MFLSYLHFSKKNMFLFVIEGLQMMSPGGDLEGHDYKDYNVCSTSNQMISLSIQPLS